jgi:hypothetical protein
MLLSLQAAFWWQSFGRLPDLGVVPPLASHQEMELLSFGDRELYFRIMAFRLNNTGDTFGRFTALKEYNLEKLYHWFSRLDTFNHRSNHLPALAAYYFSQTQKTEDIHYMVDYLYEHSKDDPKHYWWWLTQATYIAMHKLKDSDYALKIASRLEGVTGIPHWAQQMPAFVHEQRGELDGAYAIMRGILEQQETLSQGELNYMRYFMEERLKRVQEVEELLKKKQQEIDNAPPTIPNT